MMTRLLVSAALLLAAGTASADNYAIDNGHSNVVFKVKHLGVGNFYGMFHDVQGAVTFDPANVAGSSIDITVKTGSVFTADKKRDGHLKGPDFFSAKEHPTMTFKSTKVMGSGKSFKVQGELTIRGKRKTVTADVEYVGAGKDPWGNMRAGWEAKLKINRMDFGVAYMPGGLGNDVTLMIAIEGIKK